MMQKEQPQAWWFDSHNLARPSPWLGNTLSELDDKTKQMLKLIDQDADSFAQRAEMYYKKRPVLVDMLGDLYRAHRSLAEQCDLLKHGGGTRRSKVFASPSPPCTKSWSPAASMDGKAGAGSSSSSTSLCSGSSYDSESEADDPEEEHHHHGDHHKVHHHHGDHQKASEGKTEAEKKEQQPEQQQEEAAELMEEIRMLKEQNSELQKAMEESTAMYKAELAAKDEEKREVIRQLAASLDVVQGENSTLRECIKSSKHHHRPAAARAFDLKKLTRDLFSAKLFTAHCRPSGPVVAL